MMEERVSIQQVPYLLLLKSSESLLLMKTMGQALQGLSSGLLTLTSVCVDEVLYQFFNDHLPFS